MEKEFVDRAYQECGDDLDSIINRLTQLDIGLSQTDAHRVPSTSSQEASVSSSQDSIHPLHRQDCIPRTGSEWAELFVNEIKSTSCMNEAKERASRLLGVLENSVRSSEGEAVKILEKENLMLKQNLEKATSSNVTVKRVLSALVKHGHGKTKELQNLQQLVAQHEQKSRQLEYDNYVLTMHIRQAMKTTQNENISGNFLPDLF